MKLDPSVENLIKQKQEEFQLTEEEKIILRNLLIKENQLRLSTKYQNQYKDQEYELVTNLLRDEAIQTICGQELNLAREMLWKDLLHQAPLLLGLESASLANYVGGSFAATPEAKIHVGEICPSIALSTLDGKSIDLLHYLDCSKISVVIAGNFS